MDKRRRTFLSYATGLAAGVGVGEVTTASDQKHFPRYRHSVKTRELLSMFGLKYPILQAPAGGSTGPELAAAVCNAGAMGSIALTTASIETASERVKKLVSLTKGTFAVNYILSSPLSSEPKSLPAVLDAGAPVVQFSWGIPNERQAATIHAVGARFGVQVANREGARAALAAGADYLVCQGIEAGGHVQSTTPLFEVMEAVLAEVDQQPVFAAGGIADGTGIRRALEAGASGASLGTRFVATQESRAHLEYKKALLEARDGSQTALSVCFVDGWANATARSLRNDTFVRWEAAGCPTAGKRPGEGDVLATKPDGRPVLRYATLSPTNVLTGNGVADCALWAGMGVGLINELPSASDLVHRLWAECEAAASQS
ncbi:MAG: nitronate monooxygenase [Betaproteobacteria bacterium]|nr:MAG: nitronate monooxygenase [Betaproteobacteria bacterium]